MKGNKMLTDRSGRKVTYLRLSVTDRCNLRCVYCMPSTGVKKLPREEILSFDELARVVKLLVREGIEKVRITGGEPLVREGLSDFIRLIRKENERIEICLTTNGVLLPRFLDSLIDAGVNRFNVSLDTLHRNRFVKLTGFDGLEAVLKGIELLIEKKALPVKINTLVIPGFNEADVPLLIEFARDHPVTVRFIEKMPVKGEDGNGFTKSELLHFLEQVGNVEKAERRQGETAAIYHMRGFKGTVGVISPLTDAFCHDCNRIRITAEGKILNCLLMGSEFDLKKTIRSGASDNEIVDQIRLALQKKPEGIPPGCLKSNGYLRKCMIEIGG